MGDLNDDMIVENIALKGIYDDLKHRHADEIDEANNALKDETTDNAYIYNHLKHRHADEIEKLEKENRLLTGEKHALERDLTVCKDEQEKCNRFNDHFKTNLTKCLKTKKAQQAQPEFTGRGSKKSKKRRKGKSRKGKSRKSKRRKSRK